LRQALSLARTDLMTLETVEHPTRVPGVLSIARADIGARLALALRTERESPAWKYFLATALFLASRLVVFLGYGFGVLLRPPPMNTALHIDVPRLAPLMHWDANWYLAVLHDGYKLADTPGAPSDIAFFPLYPMLAWAAKTLGGLSEPTALIFVANAMALLSTLLIVKLGIRYFSEPIALYAAAIFCFFPESFFLSSAYNESTCLALFLLSLLALGDGRFGWAALAAGAASGVRVSGLAMAPVVALAVELSKGRSLPRRTILAAGAGLLACGGLIAYMAYQDYAFGDPMAFVAAQKGWKHENFLVQVLNGLELKPIFEGRLDEAAWFVVPMALLIFNYRFLPRDLSVCGLTSLGIPYFAYGVSSSSPRYAILCVPLYFCLARGFRASPMLAAVVFGLSTTLLCLHTAMFTQWYWVG